MAGQHDLFSGQQGDNPDPLVLSFCNQLMTWRAAQTSFETRNCLFSMKCTTCLTRSGAWCGRRP